MIARNSVFEKTLQQLKKNAKVMFFLDFEKKTLKKRKNVPIVSHYSQATQLQEVITGKSR